MPIHKRVKVQIEFEVSATKLDNDKFDATVFEWMFPSRAWIKNIVVSNPVITTLKIPTTKNENLRRMNEYKRIIQSITKVNAFADNITIRGATWPDRSIIELFMPIADYGSTDIVSCVCKDSIITLEGRYSYLKGEELVVNLASPNAVELLTSGITKNVGEHVRQCGQRWPRPNGGAPS